MLRENECNAFSFQVTIKEGTIRYVRETKKYYCLSKNKFTHVGCKRSTNQWLALAISCCSKYFFNKLSVQPELSVKRAINKL